VATYRPFSDSSSIATVAPLPDFTRRQSKTYRSANVQSDVLVPLITAAVTGIILAIIATVLWISAHWSPWVILIAFLSGFVLVWVWRLALFDKLLVAGEEITHLDLNRDNVIGAPPPEPVPEVRIELKLSEANRSQPNFRRFSFPCDQDTLVEVADVMLAGSTLPESEWAGLKAGKPFSEDKLKKFKAILVAQGLSRWVNPENPRLGIVLTDNGRQFMERVRDAGMDADDPTPPPQQ
jgi:hypothetical protein